MLKRKATTADLKAAIDDLDVEVEQVEQRLKAHVEQIGAASFDGQSLDELNREKREIEDLLAGVKAKRAEVQRRYEAAKRAEAEAEYDRLEKKQLADCHEAHRLASELSVVLAEIKADDVSLSGLSNAANAQGRQRPLGAAIREWQEAQWPRHKPLRAGANERDAVEQQTSEIEDWIAGQLNRPGADLDVYKHELSKLVDGGGKLAVKLTDAKDAIAGLLNNPGSEFTGYKTDLARFTHGRVICIGPDYGQSAVAQVFAMLRAAQ